MPPLFQSKSSTELQSMFSETVNTANLTRSRSAQDPPSLSIGFTHINIDRLWKQFSTNCSALTGVDFVHVWLLRKKAISDAIFGYSRQYELNSAFTTNNSIHGIIIIILEGIEWVFGGWGHPLGCSNRLLHHTTYSYVRYSNWQTNNSSVTSAQLQHDHASNTPVTFS